MLSFRLTKQTSKNVADTIFKIDSNSHLMLDVFPPVFLSKVICVATSHSSGVMVNSTFPLMDGVIRVQGMPEFVHQDCFKLTDKGGTHKHSCTLKPLSIQVPSQLFCLLLYVHFWSEKLKNVQKSEWNYEEIFFPHMSTCWCNQLNEGVNKLTRRKPFLWQNFFRGNVGVYHRGHLFTFI